MILTLVAATVVSQKSVMDLSPVHRAAVQKYIDRNKSNSFLPETWFERDTLKAARSQWGFGAKFRPYYQVGDFNRDKRQDFAVILLVGKSAGSPKGGMNIVIFNGGKGGYEVAHIDREPASTALYLRFNNQLHAGIMETDSVWRFVRAGKGYITDPVGG